MIKKSLILVILLISTNLFSQEIYQSDYKIKYSAFKSINESKGDRVFSQLTLNPDNTYLFEGYSYSYKNKEKFIINCSKYSGTWSKSGDIIILETKVPTVGNNVVRYKISKKGELIPMGLKKRRWARKTKFQKVKTKENIVCPEVQDYPENDLN